MSVHVYFFSIILEKRVNTTFSFPFFASCLAGDEAANIDLSHRRGKHRTTKGETDWVDDGRVQVADNRLPGSHPYCPGGMLNKGYDN